MTRKVGILISGRGSNMMSLAEAARDPACPYDVAIVASDKPDAAGLAWARDAGLATFAQSPKACPKPSTKPRSTPRSATPASRSSPSPAICACSRDDFVARWRGRIVNIHPSLLPKYKGLDTHQRAIDAGDAVAGCSVHIVTEELDGGEVLRPGRGADPAR